MKSFRTKTVVLLLAVGLVLAACGNDDEPTAQDDGGGTDQQASDETTEEPEGLDQLVAAAQEEGQVVFYSSLAEETLQALADAFQEEYGIEVVYQRLAAGPAKERISQETQSGNVQVDVLSATLDPEFLAEMSDGGHLTALDEGAIPNLSALPNESRGDYHAVGHVETWGVVYNTDLVSEDELPETFAEIADKPEWRGKFVIPDAKLGGGYFNWYFAILESLGEADFETFIEGIAGDMQPQLATESMSGPLNQVVAGELMAAVPVQSSLAQKLIDSGAPVAYDTTVEPTGAFQLALTVLKDAPNPNAALLFVNWLLGEEAAEINCAGGDCASPHLDVDGEVLLPDTVTYVDPVEAKKTGEDYVVPLFEAARG